MAAPKFLRNILGVLTEVFATEVGGTGHEEQIVSTGTDGRIASSLMPTGIAAESVQAVANGAIGAGEAVNLYNNAGVLTARLADATTAGKEANGWAPAAISDTATGTIQIGEGLITGLSGLTIGAVQFLSTTAGQFTSTPPNAAGNIVQSLGKAMSATTIYFQPNVSPITVA